MMTGDALPVCVAVARIARSRRSASAASSSARVEKRRSSIFGMVNPLAGRGAWTLDDLHFHVELTAASLIVEGHHHAGLAAGDAGACVLGRRNGCAIDGEQQISWLHPGLHSGAADIEIGDHDAAVSEPELPRLAVGDVFRHDPDPATDDPSVLDDVVQHTADHVDGDRKTDAFHAQALGNDGGVDPNQHPAGINQRAPGVAEIDGRVRLNEVFERGDPELPAGGSADDAVSHGLREAERIAYGKHDVADLQLIGLPEGDHREVRQVDLEDCEIGIGIGADHLRLRNPTVCHLHADGACVRDHVIVRYDVAAVIDDHAGPEAALDALLVLWQDVAEELTERRGIDALGHEAGGVDVDYGGGCALHC